MSKKHNRGIATFLILTVASLFAAPAFADDPAPREVRISAADLDLGSAAGLAELYSRVRGAARAICEPARGLTGTRIASRFDNCVRETVASAAVRFKTPALTAMHVLASTRVGAACEQSLPPRKLVMM